MNSQTAVPKQNSHQQQRNIRPNKRKGSDSSVPGEEKMREENHDHVARGGRPASVYLRAWEKIKQKLI